MSVSVFRRAGARGLGIFALIVVPLWLGLGTAFRYWSYRRFVFASEKI